MEEVEEPLPTRSPGRGWKVLDREDLGLTKSRPDTAVAACPVGPKHGRVVADPG